MKKIFLFCMMALVGMCGLNSCSDDCNHEFIEHDFTQDLVGTWTYVNGEQAEAMVIKADGSFTTTGIMKGGALYEEKGTIKVVNNKVTLAFEGDNETYEGRLEFVAGKSMSIVMFDDNDVRLDYDYCKEDLSDEIVGMWVSNDGPIDMSNEIMIRTYSEDGKVTTTGVRTIGGNPEWMLNEVCNYRVIGDLVFKELSKEIAGQLKVTHSAERFVYAPKATVLGDLMNVLFYLPMGDSYVESTVSFLRVKQNLNLSGKKYDYTKTFVTNAKGEDKDIPFLDTSFNFAKMDGSIIDKFLKSILFSFEFPDANTLKYSYLIEGEEIVMAAPIEVEGNKMTVKMSENVPFYQDVEIYTFQDQDNTQMHLYIPTASFEKFFANTCVAVLLGYGDLEINDTEAIAGVYQNVADALESINLSIVMHSNK